MDYFKWRLKMNENVRNEIKIFAKDNLFATCRDFK